MSTEPLRAWWQLASDRRGTALFVELLAAANHRPALKAEVGAIAREVRRMQLEVLEAVLDGYGIDPDVFPPALVAAAVQGVAFSAVQDSVAATTPRPTKHSRRWTDWSIASKPADQHRTVVRLRRPRQSRTLIPDHGGGCGWLTTT